MVLSLCFALLRSASLCLSDLTRADESKRMKRTEWLPTPSAHGLIPHYLLKRDGGDSLGSFVVSPVLSFNDLIMHDRHLACSSRPHPTPEGLPGVVLAKALQGAAMHAMHTAVQHQGRQWLCYKLPLHAHDALHVMESTLVKAAAAQGLEVSDGTVFLAAQPRPCSNGMLMLGCLNNRSTEPC